MAVDEKLTERLEEYIEAIHVISRERHVARPKEIAARLGVHGSSVTNALQALGKRGLVNYTPYGFVTLTDAGVHEAHELLRKHRIMREFLSEVLNIGTEDAESGGHRMKHVVSETVLDRLASFLEYYRTCALLPGQWNNGQYVCAADDPKSCDRCTYPFKSRGTGTAAI